jgi:hypothetical protein
LARSTRSPQIDADRRCREREREVERLKRLVAELMFDKPMLQGIAKKTWTELVTASCVLAFVLRASALP